MLLFQGLGNVFLGRISIVDKHYSQQVPQEKNMLLSTYRPNSLFSHSLNQWLNDTPATRRTAAWQPTITVDQTDDSFILRAELPGVPVDTINIEQESGILRIQANRTKEKQTESAKADATWELDRAYQLPKTADVENISASKDDGILTITIPKKEPVKAKQIQIS